MKEFEVILSRTIIADTPQEAVREFISSMKEEWYFDVIDLETDHKIVVSSARLKTKLVPRTQK